MPLPIAIIGAGPVGLAAAAHLSERGEPFVILEAGPQVGDSALAWGHVQMFTPWRYCVDAAAERLLAAAGWAPPPADTYPTGRELVAGYLAPLAALPAIAPHLRLGARVTAVARAGLDKLKSAGRERAPFELHLETAAGEGRLLARALIDASGTYRTPSPLGASGLPASGERALAGQIFYGIPDVRGALRARYAGRRTLVVGSGHSAFNALLDLVALAEEAPGTSVTWAVRRDAAGLARAYGGGAGDALSARGKLGERMRAAVAAGRLALVTEWQTDRLERTAAGIVASAGDRALDPVDEIVVCTGLRPDLAMLGELRLGLDPAVEAPAALAPLIDPNLHSCGTVRPHGAEELRHPEPDLYIIGMKSYGRAPTFLMLTGYEQARSVAAALAGDWAAARRVELVLPETGVCSGPVAAGAEGAACCAPTAGLVAAGAAGAEGAACCAPTAAVTGTGLIALAPVAAEGAACCAPTAAEICC